MSGILQEHKVQKVHFALPEKEKVKEEEGKLKVLVIAGPTGVGKTRISLEIAKALDGEIISADSMQVYRGMDIGTAKVSKEVRQEVRHHLIDVCDLSQSFSVMQFYEEATAAMSNILGRGHVPIVVGGTGFYIHALLYGPPHAPPAAPGVRAHLELQLSTLGVEALYEKLRQLDPEYAKTISKSDRHKIVRALEIIVTSEKQVSQFPKTIQRHEQRYRFFCWFLYLPKELLYPRIEARCEEMLRQGFVEEVKNLEKQGLCDNSSAAQAIGYRQCLEWLETTRSPDDYEAFVASFKRASRQYAKRQFTWFRKEPLFRWLNLDEAPPERAAEIIIRDFEMP